MPTLKLLKLQHKLLLSAVLELINFAFVNLCEKYIYFPQNKIFNEFIQNKKPPYPIRYGGAVISGVIISPYRFKQDIICFARLAGNIRNNFKLRIIRVRADKLLC